MSNTTSRPALGLSKETVRELSTGSLEAVAGGNNGVTNVANGVCGVLRSLQHISTCLLAC